MVTVALIGTGNWGRNVVRNFAQLRSARLKYCADLDEGHLTPLRTQYPATEFTTDLDKVFGDPEVQAIGVTASAAAHHPLGMRALRAGKHVYIEKPLALSTAQARELVAEAEKRKLRLMVGHLLLYHPAVTLLKQVVDRGDLGDRLARGRPRRHHEPRAPGPHGVARDGPRPARSGARRGRHRRRRR